MYCTDEVRPTSRSCARLARLKLVLEPLQPSRCYPVAHEAVANPREESQTEQQEEQQSLARLAHEGIDLVENAVREIKGKHAAQVVSCAKS